MAAQFGLHLRRVNVVAAADIHLLEATFEGEGAVVVAGCQVTGAKPSTVKRCGGGLFVAPVADHRRRGGQAQLADPSVRQRLPVGVEDARLHPGPGPADAVQRVGGALPGRAETDATGLSGGITHQVLGVEPLSHRLHQVRR